MDTVLFSNVEIGLEENTDKAKCFHQQILQQNHDKRYLRRP